MKAVRNPLGEHRTCKLADVRQGETFILGWTPDALSSPEIYIRATLATGLEPTTSGVAIVGLAGITIPGLARLVSGDAMVTLVEAEIHYTILQAKK